LSCFAGGGDGIGCCNHLQIDMTDAEQIGEVKRIELEVTLTLDFMPEEAPQYEHFRNIKRNIEGLIAKS